MNYRLYVHWPGIYKQHISQVSLSTVERFCPARQTNAIYGCLEYSQPLKRWMSGLIKCRRSLWLKRTLATSKPLLHEY